MESYQGGCPELCSWFRSIILTRVFPLAHLLFWQLHSNTSTWRLRKLLLASKTPPCFQRSLMYHFCCTFWYQTCFFLLYFRACNSLLCEYISFLIVSLCVRLSFLCLSLFPEIISASHHSCKHSSVFLQLSLHHPKKMEGFFFFLFLSFFFCDMVPCCQGTVSMSASTSQSRQAVVRSVDLFEFYPVSREIFFGLLVCVCGKQYEMGSEKNSVTDARSAWRAQKGRDVQWKTETVCHWMLKHNVFLALCSISTLFTFSLLFPILFPGLISPWPSYSCLWWQEEELLHVIYIVL